MARYATYDPKREVVLSLLRTLPPAGHWPRQRRDAFMGALEATVKYLYEDAPSVRPRHASVDTLIARALVGQS